jgi:LmbE family N-acetylglucosaminyl deacetylase/SAM-dependent methyltransferase
LGAGGLIASAADAGLQIDVVVASAGEASHPTSSTTSQAELAQVRGQEVRAAVTRLAPTATIHLLGLPDGALSERREELRRLIEGIAGDRADPSAEVADPQHVVVMAAPWSADGHPDHDAVGAVVAELARDLGVTMLHYPIWVWHWAQLDDPRVPWAAVRTLPLSEDALRRKESAMALHRSQTEPLSAAAGDEAVLPEHVLAHFRRDEEVFIVAERAPGRSLGRGYFEDFYATQGEDPWGFETRWYERRKRALTMASLPRERFARAFEPGCSTGHLTIELAHRCDEVLAMDVADAAVQRARQRCAELPWVTVVPGSVPGDWPAGRFDLVLLSEVGYYSAGNDLDELVRRAGDALTDDGVLVACHWRHEVADYPVGGDVVHRALRQHSRLSLLATHEEEDFLLDVLVTTPGSVARAEGLLT